MTFEQNIEENNAIDVILSRIEFKEIALEPKDDGMMKLPVVEWVKADDIWGVR